MSCPAYTPTQRRILAVLSDGRPHPYGDLIACLYDDQGTAANVQPHITYLRRKLKPLGQTILGVRVRGRHCYRLIALPA